MELTTMKKKPNRTKLTAMEGGSSNRVITPGQRLQMINEAAYYRAEKRGFQNGSPANDWVEAEREVDTWIGRVDQLVRR